MTFDKVGAISSLRPGAEWAMAGDEITWMDTNQTQPTESEIQAEITRLQTKHDADEYKRNRELAYPTVGDQLDMIYHAGQGGDEFQAAIKAVKDKYPKE